MRQRVGAAISVVPPNLEKSRQGHGTLLNGMFCDSGAGCEQTWFDLEDLAVTFDKRDCHSHTKLQNRHTEDVLAVPESGVESSIRVRGNTAPTVSTKRQQHLSPAPDWPDVSGAPHTQ